MNARAGGGRCRPALALACLALATLLAAGCWPEHPTAWRVAGTWTRSHDWSHIDTLILAADGTFRQILHGPGLRVWRARGRWHVERPDPEATHGEDFAFVGSKVVLDRAYNFHINVFDLKDEVPLRSEQWIEARSEWGRSVLHFNPDVECYTKRMGAVPNTAP